MKKISLLLLLVVLLIPLTVFAQAEGISIKSAVLEEKSTTATQLAEPTYTGLELSFNVKFKNVNDFAKYKVTIENTSDTEYEIETVNPFDTSSYMTYQYSFEDNNKVVGAHSNKVMTVLITYSTQVPSTAFSGTKYEEDNVLSINVDSEIPDPPEPNTDTPETPPKEDPKPEEPAETPEKKEEDKEVENPKTGASLPWMILIGTLIIGLGIYLTTKKKLPFKNISILIIAIGISIPLIASAVEKLYVKVNTHVVIERTLPHFTISCLDASYEFEENMSWNEFVNSGYNRDNWEISDNEYSSTSNAPKIIYVSDSSYYIELTDNTIRSQTYECSYIPDGGDEGDGY